MDDENEELDSMANEGQESNDRSDSYRSKYNQAYNRLKDRQERKENAGKKFEDKAKKADKKSKALNEKGNLQANQGQNFRAARNRNNALRQQEKAKKYTDKAKKAKEQAQKAEKFANLAAKIGKFIATVGWIIVLIIIIIGLLVFVLTGLGMIWDSIKGVLDGIGDWFTKLRIGQENMIKEEDITDVLVDLQEMGYDLYGYGFTTYVTPLEEEESTSVQLTDDDNNEGVKKTTSYKLAHDMEDGGYDNIRAYLVSDNYKSILKNDNKSLYSMAHAFGKFIGMTTDDSSYDGYGKGLISVYYDTGVLGMKGAEQAEYLFGEISNGITVNIKGGKELEISHGAFSNSSFTYNLDGWTGRYGMPLEFLLSVHIATMSPDLSLRLATSFNTDVQILLNHAASGGTIKSGIADKEKETSFLSDSDVLTHDDFLDIIQQLPSFSDSLSKFMGNIPIVGGTASNVLENVGDWFNLHRMDSKEAVEVMKWAYKNRGVRIENPNCEGPKSESYTVDGQTIHCYDYAQNKVKKDGDNNLTLVGAGQGDNLKEIEACDSCCDYMKNIFTSLQQTKDLSLDTWVPYINCVTDHWFRNVYFSTNAIMYGDEITSSDTIYEKQTEERWTLYETYSTATGGAVQSSDYKLYIYLPDSTGNYNVSSNFDTGKDFWKVGDDYILCKYTDKHDGKYKKDDDGITFVKCAGNEKGDYNLVKNDPDNNYPEYTETEPDKFRTSKKAIITSTYFKGKDSAYTVEAADDDASKWADYEGGDNTNAINAVQEMETVKLVYRASYGNIVQVEDGIRGATNSKIKNIFLDDYYLYDGSKKTATLINMAKRMAYLRSIGMSESAVESQMEEAVKKAENENRTSEAKDIETFGLASTVLDKLVSFFDVKATDPDLFTSSFDKDTKIKAFVKDEEDDDKKGEVYTATIDQLKGSVSINRTALSAFAILENLHTLDAEYIYRDFKELLVELNYFNKEDLGDAAEDVMMFPISGVGASGWPDEKYDKGEEYYGTLIHSSDDYDAKRAETKLEVARILGTVADEEHNSEAEEDENVTTPIQNVSEDNSQTSTTSTNPLVLAAADVMSILVEDGEYCQGTGAYEEDANNLYPDWHKNHHFRALSLEQLKQQHSTDCSGFVSICLQQVGIMNEGESSNSQSFASNLGDVDYKIISSPAINTLEEGDICVFTGHVNIYAGNNLFYDWGAKRTTEPCTYNSSIKYAIRIPASQMTYKGMSVNSSSSSSADAIFPGYEGGEPVLAPVTGEVLKYGTVERENIETGKTEEVGFMKIKVLDVGVSGNECEAFVGEGNRKDVGDSSEINSQAAQKWLSENYDEDQLKKLGYDYFWEEYNNAGIAGCVLYIEGFEPVNGISGSSRAENITSLKEYIEEHGESECNYQTLYTVPSLEDKKYQFELNVAEEAKKQAINVLEANVKKGDEELGQKIYIKEGAVIGHTYSVDSPSDGMEITEVEVIDNEGNTDETASNKEENSIATKIKEFMIGNYIRLIFRDEDDEVRENVEDYIEIPNAESGTMNLSVNSDFSAQAEALISLLGIQVNSSSSTIQLANQYWEKIVQYSNEFGIDPYLVRAMICQESSANPNNDNGSAYGLMQWEYSANGTEIEVENAAGNLVKITGITKSALSASVDLQLRAGCAELKSKLSKYNENIPAFLTAYNNGDGGFNVIINHHMNHQDPNPNTGNSDTVKQFVASGNIDWINDGCRQWKKEHYGGGDPLYIEHVLQYYVTN